eukprot:3941945-Rhodomonas_salina.2
MLQRHRRSGVCAQTDQARAFLECLVCDLATIFPARAVRSGRTLATRNLKTRDARLQHILAEHIHSEEPKRARHQAFTSVAEQLTDARREGSRSEKRTRRVCSMS